MNDKNIEKQNIQGEAKTITMLNIFETMGVREKFLQQKLPGTKAVVLWY